MIYKGFEDVNETQHYQTAAGATQLRMLCT